MKTVSTLAQLTEIPDDIAMPIGPDNAPIRFFGDPKWNRVQRYRQYFDDDDRHEGGQSLLLEAVFPEDREALEAQIKANGGRWLNTVIAELLPYWRTGVLLSEQDEEEGEVEGERDPLDEAGSSTS